MSRGQKWSRALLGCVATLGGVYACSGDARLIQSVAPTSSVQSADAARRIEVARIAAARAGELHHAAMQDLLAHMPTGPNARSKEARCQLAAEVTLRQMPHIAAAYGAKWSDAEQRRLVREAFRSIGPCKSEHGMNMLESYVGASMTTMATDDPPGTEAVVARIYDLVNAVKYSDGTIASVEAITSASLANNSSLGAVDLQILASVAALANSSAVEWNTYYGDATWQGEWDWSGGGGLGAPVGCTNWPGECTRTTPEAAYSIFSASGFWRKAGFVAVSDVIGCATAAAETWWSGAAGAGASCVIWGIGTSAVSAAGLVML